MRFCFARSVSSPDRVDKAKLGGQNEKASQQGVDAINIADLHTAYVPEWRNWQTR
jgi:hypothetical protein